jgi:hypothetical protein
MPIKIYDATGPYVIKRKGNIIDDDNIAEFCKQHDASLKRRGVYIFAIRASKGFTPFYVGKTKKSFGKEIFQSHKRVIYCKALNSVEKGSPVFFFISEPAARGSAGVKAIDEVETHFIKLAKGANAKLLNKQKMKAPTWGVRGIERGGKGQPSESAKALKRCMNLK